MGTLPFTKYFRLQGECVCVHSVVFDSFATPWTVAHWAPLSKEFSRQKYWSGLPFPTSGDRLKPGIKPMSCASLMLAQPAGSLFNSGLLCLPSAINGMAGSVTWSFCIKNQLFTKSVFSLLPTPHQM